MLKTAYHDAATSIQQTQVAALVAASVLEQFPSRLPDNTRVRLASILRQLGEALMGAAAAAEALKEQQQAEASSAYSVRIPIDDPVLWPAVSLLLANALAKREGLKIDFAPLLFSQSLVTTLAHVDGFMSEAVRIACQKEPRLLRRGKQLTWQQVLDAGSWDALIENITEEYVFEFGWKTLTTRIEYLKSEMGVDMNTSADDIVNLEEAYQIRHVIIHNGGRVSREFLMRTRRSDLVLGQRVPVTTELSQRVSVLAGAICKDVAVGVARKYFDVEDGDFSWIGRRTQKTI